jgi:hypothetical protein
LLFFLLSLALCCDCCFVTLDGRQVFLSHRTYNKGAKQHNVVAEDEKRDLETILVFDQFGELKTAANIASWPVNGHNQGGIKADYILCHVTDGASNAVASSLEFQGITSGLKETRNISHSVYMAHKVNRSAKYASGTGDFCINQNPELAAILKKMHEINGRIYRSKARLNILFQVQREKNW